MGKLNENQAFFFFFNLCSLKVNNFFFFLLLYLCFGNVQVSGRTYFIHVSKSIQQAKGLCALVEVSYREWMHH